MTVPLTRGLEVVVVVESKNVCEFVTWELICVRARVFVNLLHDNWSAWW
jgi:hypothetical protein